MANIFKSLERSILRPIGNAISGVFKWIAGIEDPEDPRGLEVGREGSNINLPVVYGQRLVGGVTVHKWVTSSVSGLTGITSVNRTNAYLHMIVAFCHGEIESFEEMYFNGDLSTDDQFNNSFYFQMRTGAEGQSVISEAVTNIPNWENTSIGNRVAYGYFCFYQDEDQTIWRGEPEIQAIIKGRKVYDPRTDTTAWSRNNALCSLDYLTDNLYGRGLALNQIGVTQFENKADFCDETTESTITTTQWLQGLDKRIPPTPNTVVSTIEIPRYQMDAIIDTSDTLLNNYRRLLQSFRAFPRRSNGVVSLEVETSGSPVMTFDSALGQINGSINWTHGGQRDRYNAFTVTFPNESNRYERDEVTYPDPESTLYEDWLEEDNNKELDGSLDINTISSKSAALQTAEIAAKRSRFGGRLSVNVDSRATVLDGGDIIGISDESYGWTNKPFRVDTANELSNNTFDLELVEHENSVYPWSGSEWGQVDGGTWLGNPYLPESPTDLVITPDLTLATTGTLTWTSVDDNFVRSYDVSIDLIDGGTTQIKKDNTRGTRYVIPLLDIGEYNINVYAISTLGYRSDASVVNFTLVIPGAPTSIALTAGDWDINAAPQLTGVGLGTSFEFDFVLGDGTGHTPTVQAQGTTYSINGLLPGTLYTVFARTINPYGESAWVNNSITTTNTGEQVEDFITDITDPIQIELDAAELRIDAAELRLDSAEDEINDADQKINNLQSDVTVLTIDDIAQISSGVVDAYNNQLRIDQIRTTDGIVTATVTRVDLIEVDTAGNAVAISALDARVEDNEEFASAQLVLNSEYDSDLDTLTARAFLGTDVSGRVTGINIESNPSVSVISFIGDKVEFLRPTDNSVAFEWDSGESTFTYDGKLIAATGTFTGDLVASGGTFTGTLTAVDGEFTGTLTGVDGTFTGTLTAGTVTGSTITGGTVTGSVIKSASTGQRVEIEGTTQKFFPATGTDYVSLDGDTISEVTYDYDYITVSPSSGRGGFAFPASFGDYGAVKISPENGMEVGVFEGDGSDISTMWFSPVGNGQVNISTTLQSISMGGDISISSNSDITLQSSSSSTSDFIDIKKDGSIGVRVGTFSSNTYGAIYYGGSSKISTSSTGVTVTGTVTEVSDPTLKDFTRELDGAESLQMICDTNLYEYTFKDQKRYGSGLQVGVDAMQAGSVFANSICMGDDETLGFNYRHAYIHGLSAIKELSKRVDELESKLNN